MLCYTRTILYYTIRKARVPYYYVAVGAAPPYLWDLAGRLYIYIEVWGL